MQTKLLLAGLIGLLLAACASRPAQYTVDPEFQLNTNQIASGKTFMVSVQPPSPATASAEDTLTLSPDNQFDKAIKSNLIKALGAKGYRFSSNPHFSDLSITLDFSQLSVQIKKQLMRDTLEVDGHLTLELSRKDTTFKKSFQRKQTMTVAFRSDYAEATGLVNDVVSNLLQTALNDSQVVDFINKTQ